MQLRVVRNAPRLVVVRLESDSIYLGLDPCTWPLVWNARSCGTRAVYYSRFVIRNFRRELACPTLMYS